MNIYIVTPGFKHQNSIALLTPILIWQNQINEAGFKFIISQKISDSLEGDIVILDSKFHRNDWIRNQEKIYNDFLFLKKNLIRLFTAILLIHLDGYNPKFFSLLINIGNYKY